MKIITSPTVVSIEQDEREIIRVTVNGIPQISAIDYQTNYPLRTTIQVEPYSPDEGPPVVLSPYYASLYKKYGEFIEDPTREDLTGFVDFNINEFNLIVSHIGALELSFEAYERGILWLSKENPLKLSPGPLQKWLFEQQRGMLPACYGTSVTYSGTEREFSEFIYMFSVKEAGGEEMRLLANILTDSLRGKFPSSFQ